LPTIATISKIAKNATPHRILRDGTGYLDALPLNGCVVGGIGRLSAGQQEKTDKERGRKGEGEKGRRGDRPTPPLDEPRNCTNTHETAPPQGIEKPGLQRENPLLPRNSSKRLI